MKKLVLSILLSVALLSANAQTNIYLLAYGGGLTGSSIFPVSGAARVKGNWCYGSGLEFGLPFGAITLSWTGMNSKLSSSGVYGSYPSGDIGLKTNYYQLGFEKNLSDGKVKPHTIFSLGAAQFIPEENKTVGENWFFAATFGFGVKAELNEKIMLRVQAKGNMPLEMGGAGIFCGFGGCSPNVYFNPIVFQGEFTAGLEVKLNN